MKIDYNSSNRMMNKENKIPNKQGVLFQLNLGKDHGPYLAKDIMHNNPKSISLLAGTQIVRSFASLNQTLKLCETKQKEYSQSMSGVQCISTLVGSIEQQIQSNTAKSNKLKLQQGRLRNDFQRFNDKMNQSNGTLMQQYMPLLKSLYKVVKEQSGYQKEQNFRMQKQLDEMRQSKRQIIEGIFRCEQKIINIEKYLGLTSKRPEQLKK